MTTLYLALGFALGLLAVWCFRREDTVAGLIVLGFAVGIAGHWTVPAVAAELVLFGAAIYLRWRSRPSPGER